jgi:hypothetical protein
MPDNDARAAEMQKISTLMTLVVAPWVSRAVGESASALRYLTGRAHEEPERQEQDDVDQGVGPDREVDPGELGHEAGHADQHRIDHQAHPERSRQYAGSAYQRSLY